MTIQKVFITVFFRLLLVLELGFICDAVDQSNRAVPGERFVGPIVQVVGTVGQQQCVRECRDRPNLCRGVNHRKQNLLCELISDTREVERNSGYVRFELESTMTSKCASCSSDKKCVTLSSNQTYCIKDYFPGDCTAFHNQESTLLSGLYRVEVPVLGYVNVFCEMDIDDGGWTVFQRRQDGSVDFFRNWTDYKDGFGDLRNEFWLGNDILHYLLSQGMYELRMDMSDFDNQARYVKYSRFYVGDEASKYTVTLSGFSGDIGDCFTTDDRGINNMMFSTKDQDSDVHSDLGCANKFHAGWWYSDCHCANPNGEYLTGHNTQFGEGITYEAWRGQSYSLKSTQLMVRQVY